MHKTVLLRTLQNQTALNGTTLHSTSLYICSIVGIEPTEANLRWKEHFTILYYSNHNLTLKDHKEQNETEQDKTEHNYSVLHKTVHHIKICSLLGLKPNLSGKSARDKTLNLSRHNLSIHDFT